MTSSATAEPARTVAPSGTERITLASAASSIPSPASGGESTVDGCSTGIVQLPGELSIPIPHADHGKFRSSLQPAIGRSMIRNSGNRFSEKHALGPRDHAGAKEADRSGAATILLPRVFSP